MQENNIFHFFLDVVIRLVERVKMHEAGDSRRRHEGSNIISITKRKRIDETCDESEMKMEVNIRIQPPWNGRRQVSRWRCSTAGWHGWSPAGSFSFFWTVVCAAADAIRCDRRYARVKVCPVYVRPSSGIVRREYEKEKQGGIRER